MLDDATDPVQMPLGQLVRSCRDETARFRSGERSDDRFCFEIVRRAVRDRDPIAWEAIIDQYHAMVVAWVKRHPASASLNEDHEYWVTAVFERFWLAVKPERLDSFPDLPSVLKYLKMCTHSVLLDEVRARTAAQADPIDETTEQAATSNAEGDAVGALSGRELWAAIERVVGDEAERRVIYLSLVLDYKPAEIQARHPDLYPSVADVYRIKRNALDRLRRSAEIRDFLGDVSQNATTSRSLKGQ